MGAARDEKSEVSLPNNPFVPPKGDICFINSLPPELLSHIFDLGSADDDIEDDDIRVDNWDNHEHQLDPEEQDTQDSGGKVKGGSGDEDEGTEEEETDDDDDDDYEDSDATGSSDYPPWPPFPIIASHVCRHWRDVAFSTPSLWTTIMVPPAGRPPYELTSTLLERSKGLPIDIYVNCEPHDDDYDIEPPSDADLEFLLSMLTPHIHRWRTMEFTVSEYHHIYVFLSAVSDPSTPAASQLTTLELYHHEETEDFDNFGYPSMSKHLTLFGGSAPLLKNLVLWGVHVDWSQPWIASASSLRDLELSYHAEDVRPSWSQLASVLRGAPLLEKLTLRASGPSGEPPGWFIEPTLGGPPDLNAPVLLPRLTDFTLAFHTQSRAIGLLHKLCLPALKNLVLDFEIGDYTDFVHELARPATSLSPPSSQEKPRSLLSNLESLKIAGLPCQNDCVETIYAELQNLTSLNISLTYLHELFLDILGKPCTLAGYGDTWLPRLVNLYVSGTSGDVLRQIVKTRRDAGAPLHSLYVEEACDIENWDARWLKRNLKTFELFEGSDDEDVVDFEDLGEEIDDWSDYHYPG